MAKETGQDARTREATAPHPDDPRKPDELSDIKKPSWKYIARKTMREFSSDHATDLAAALTYFGVLAVFPTILAFVSILGLFGDAAKTTNDLIDIARGFAPAGTLDALRDPIENLTKSPAAGFALLTGIVGALWSASGYVGAFSRAMNRIYQIQEGRPFWKLRPVTLVVTVLAVVVAVVAAVLLVLSGPVASTIADSIGLGTAGLVAWEVIKWPILIALAIALIAVLYYATPNVKQPRFRWMSVGALVALLTLVVASIGFAFYVGNFSSYNETYGSIGGVIVFLLWVWIGNIALLFGAELDAELERGRQLQAGIKAEEQIQLPPRDSAASAKKEKQHAKDVAAGRALRLGLDPAQATLEPAEPERDAKRDLDKMVTKTNIALRATVIAQSKAIINPKPKRK
jgi:membrane protein